MITIAFKYDIVSLALVYHLFTNQRQRNYETGVSYGGKIIPKSRIGD